MEGLLNELLPSKSLKHQERYLSWSLFKTRYSKIFKSIFFVYEIFDHLDYLIPLWTSQGFTNN